MKTLVFYNLMKNLTGFAAATFSFLYISKHTKVVSRRWFSADCRPCNDFIEWSKRWFDGVSHAAPVFYCSSDNIEVLTHPSQFYDALKFHSRIAKRRITLASLYLGNGKKEEDLVNEIYENLAERREICDQLKVNVLLEYTRGSRGVKNSRTMLLPLLKDFVSQTNVALFHTPNLRGILRKVIPARFDETISVAHLKVYLFDDTLIMSGANLSDDYFTNRQDRYIVFHNSKQLCDYFDELVATISKFSFQLQPDNTLQLHPQFSFHPYKSSKRKFNAEAGRLLENFIEKHSRNATFTHDSIIHLKERTTNDTNGFKVTNEYSSARSQYRKDSNEKRNIIPNTINSFLGTDTTDNSENNFEEEKSDCVHVENGEHDTLVFPLLQMRSMGVRQDELFTRQLLASTPENADLLLATAYFNLTDDYWKALLGSKANIHLLMAHPRSMGFYKAAGMAGGIPTAYSLISKRRFVDLESRHQDHRIQFHEFFRHGWTFHGKGLWAFMKNNQTEVNHDNEGPFLTLIGSPNFGKRSVYRDMEAQVGIITTNKKLTEAFLNERDSMWKDTKIVNRETFHENERKIKWWVWGIATFLNQLF